MFSSAACHAALKQPLTTDAAIGYYLTQLMRCAGEGYACAVLLDRERRHVATVTLKRGGLSADEPMLELLCRECEERGAAYLAVAHCHADGELRPSRADSSSTARIKERFEDGECTFLDHFIVAKNSYITVLGDSCCRKYAETEEML